MFPIGLLAGLYNVYRPLNHIHIDEPKHLILLRLRAHCCFIVVVVVYLLWQASLM